VKSTKRRDYEVPFGNMRVSSSDLSSASGDINVLASFLSNYVEMSPLVVCGSNVPTETVVQSSGTCSMPLYTVTAFLDG
jgi:hypothetical protein